MQKKIKSIRKAAALLLIAGAFCATSLTAQTHPPLGGGSGSSGDPYKIATPEHLKALADYVNDGYGDNTLGVCYRVENNLDLSDYAAGAGWTPIGSHSYPATNLQFQGNFDGNGKIITNLTIDRPTQDYVGLFGYLHSGSEVHDLGVINCNVTGQSRVGGIVGWSYALIENCYVSGTVTGTNNHVGGIVGENAHFVKNCYSTATVSGNIDVGGVAGVTNDEYSFLEYCYATGEITGATCVGGVAGFSEGVVQYCVAANSSITATTATTQINRIAGCCGYGFTSNYVLATMTVTVNGAPVSITPDLNGMAGADATLAQLQSLAFYENLGWDIATDNSKTWKICDGLDLPFLAGQGKLCLAEIFCGGNGSEEDPYQICTPEQLDKVRDALDKHFILMNDIDLNIPPYNTGSGWEPIGKYSSPYTGTEFEGTFDGNNHKITGLFINRPTTDYVGLFGGTKNATIKNLGIEGCDVTGRMNVGGLVGHNDGSNSGNATITNCVAANASITATGAFINRILGYNYNGTLTNNYALETMLVNGSTVTGGTLNDEGGADATLAELHSLSFYNTAGNWDTDAWDIDDPIGVWNICDGDGMPFLRWQKNILCSNEHLIIATAGANGSISPSGNVIVNTGDAQTFTFTPDSGYEIDEILIDGSAISTANSYTFTDVKEDHTIHVTFKADVGIANVEAYGIRPHVYPNPTTGKFTIYDLRLDDLKLEIYDVVGQVVGTYRIRPTKDETVIDISHLATGLYFLKTDGKTVKVVKE